MRGRERAQQLEAAQVCPEQEAASTLGERAAQRLQSPHLDVEATEPAVDEIHAVEDRRSKSKEMPPEIGQARRPPESEREVLARSAPRARRKSEEISANRIEQQTRAAPAAAQSEPLHELRRAAAAPFAMGQPGRLPRSVHLRAVRRRASLPARATVRTTSARGRCS